MDIGTGLALFGSAKIVEKLLGPTADYVGSGAKDWVRRRVENVDRIFEKAAKRLGPQIEQPGAVPPKVVEGIVNQGSYCDDELGAEYWGGVLASSRTEAPRDDRGASLNALLSRLSTYQIRAHYILYSVLRKLFQGTPLRFDPKERHKLSFYVPVERYVEAMQFEASEVAQLTAITEHVCFGLHRESLIHDFHYGSPDELRPLYPTMPGAGLVIQPSVMGGNLFLWAHGHRTASAHQMLDPGLAFELETKVLVPDGAPCEPRQR